LVLSDAKDFKSLYDMNFMINTKTNMHLSEFFFVPGAKPSSSVLWIWWAVFSVFMLAGLIQFMRNQGSLEPVGKEGDYMSMKPSSKAADEEDTENVESIAQTDQTDDSEEEKTN
jgi:hypothetical protein